MFVSLILALSISNPKVQDMRCPGAQQIFAWGDVLAVQTREIVENRYKNRVRRYRQDGSTDGRIKEISYDEPLLGIDSSGNLVVGEWSFPSSITKEMQTGSASTPLLNYSVVDGHYTLLHIGDSLIAFDRDNLIGVISDVEVDDCTTISSAYDQVVIVRRRNKVTRIATYAVKGLKLLNDSSIVVEGGYTLLNGFPHSSIVFANKQQVIVMLTLGPPHPTDEIHCFLATVDTISGQSKNLARITKPGAHSPVLATRNKVAVFPFGKISYIDGDLIRTVTLPQ